MNNLTLVIGNKNYSSWSMRAWLFMKAFNLEFTEILESLNGDDLDDRLLRYSKSKKVPVLIDGEIIVWDSLAICTYLSEKYLNNRGYPKSFSERATALSISQEMHSSFFHLRNNLPMNCRAKRKIDISQRVQNDISRIDEIWSTCREKNNQSPWLFSEFSIADCMFAPVASRFSTYGVNLSESAQEYQQNILQHPAVVQWYQSALLEKEIVEVDEAGVDIK